MESSDILYDIKENIKDNIYKLKILLNNEKHSLKTWNAELFIKTQEEKSLYIEFFISNINELDLKERQEVKNMLMNHVAFLDNISKIYNSLFCDKSFSEISLV
jgi:hypothetical protein